MYMCGMCIHGHVWHVGRGLIKGFLKGIAYPCSSFPPNNIILYSQFVEGEL